MSVKMDETASETSNPTSTIKEKCYQCVKGPANIITTLVVVACFVASCIQVANCIRKIYKPPISTFTHFDFNKTLLYPAVTFCRDPPYKFKELEKYGLYAHPRYTSVWRQFDFDSVSLDELWAQTTYNSSEYFVQLGLNHEKNNIDIIPTLGFAMGMCYTLKPKIRLTTATKRSGYSVLLQHSAEDIATSTSTVPPGYHVYIHSNNEPFTEVAVPGGGLVDHLYVNVGEDIDIKLTVNEYIKISRNHDRCLHKLNYSASNCTNWQVWAELAAGVGCSGPWMESAFPRCNNYNDMRALITNYMQTYDQDTSTYTCPRLCQAFLYQAFVTSRKSATNWDFSKQAWSQTSGEASLQTQLYIHFNSMMVSVYEERHNYDLSVFLADLGGSVGFLLGLSVIGVIQILSKAWNMLIRPFISLPKHRKQREVTHLADTGKAQLTTDEIIHKKCKEWNNKNNI